MASLLQNVAEQAAIDRPERFPQLYALLVTLQGYVTASTMPAFVASAIEETRVTSTLTAWRLVLAVNSNISRVEVVPRAVTRDPPAYLDAVTSAGVAFSLQRVGGEYLINGTGKLNATSFTNALARAFSSPTP